MQGPFEIDLPDGLPRARLDALAVLMRQVAGLAPDAPPEPARGLFWPLLLLAEMPEALIDAGFATGSGEMLVHEALRIRLHGSAAPVDGGLRLAGTVAGRGGLVSLAAGVRDKTGRTRAEIEVRLRRVPLQGLAAGARLSLERAARGGALRRVATPVIGQDAIDRFVGLTGDPNPIHTDRAQARSLGLGDTVVPGALLIGMLDPVLPLLVPSVPLPAGVSVRFLAPLPCRGRAVFAADESAPAGAALRVHVADGDDTMLAIADLAFGG